MQHTKLLGVILKRETTSYDGNAFKTSMFLIFMKDFIVIRNEFQIVGTATGKARFPTLSLVLATKVG